MVSGPGRTMANPWTATRHATTILSAVGTPMTVFTHKNRRGQPLVSLDDPKRALPNGQPLPQRPRQARGRV
jgi:hypothetical protein